MEGSRTGLAESVVVDAASGSPETYPSSPSKASCETTRAVKRSTIVTRTLPSWDRLFFFLCFLWAAHLTRAGLRSTFPKIPRIFQKKTSLRARARRSLPRARARWPPTTTRPWRSPGASRASARAQARRAAIYSSRRSSPSTSRSSTSRRGWSTSGSASRSARPRLAITW